MCVCVCGQRGKEGENECEWEKGGGGGRDTTRQNVILAITRGRLHYRSDAIYFSKCSGRGADRTKGRRVCVCVCGEWTGRAGRGGGETDECNGWEAAVPSQLERDRSNKRERSAEERRKERRIGKGGVEEESRHSRASWSADGLWRDFAKSKGMRVELFQTTF